MSDEVHSEEPNNTITADASELAFQLFLSSIRQIDGLAGTANQRLRDLYESGVDITIDDLLAGTSDRGQEASDESADHQAD